MMLHLGILASICTDPHDIGLRLIYADWLEEHADSSPCPSCDGKGQKVASIYGTFWTNRKEPLITYEKCSGCQGRGIVADGMSERAEFIRVQCELARMDDCGEGQWPDDGHTCHQYPCPVCTSIDQYNALRRRERELLREHYPQWIGSLLEAFGVKGGKLGTGWNNLDSRISHDSFRRGFVETVTCTCADWLQHGPAIVLCQPILEVRLTNVRIEHVSREPGFPCYRAFLPELRDRYYEIPKGAEAAASRVALAWARQQAGLPALEVAHAR